MIRKSGLSKTLGVAAAVVTLSGCLTSQDLTREEKIANGVSLGAIAGGVLAYNIAGGGDPTSKFILALLGAGVGGVGGYFAADRLTRWDKTSMNDTAFRSLNEASSGQTLTWANDDSGHSGSFTPVRTYLDHKGRICRDFEMTLKVEAEPAKGRRTACRTATGAWVII